MLKTIRERKLVEVVSYAQICYRSRNSGGFGFECDANGIVDVAALNPGAKANYEFCMSSEGLKVYPVRYLETYHNSYWEPAVKICESCQKHLEFDGHDVYCDCGAIYNGSGQRLCDPSHWGEETGESLADIYSTHDPEEIR